MEMFQLAVPVKVHMLHLPIPQHMKKTKPNYRYLRNSTQSIDPSMLRTLNNKDMITYDVMNGSVFNEQAHLLKCRYETKDLLLSSLVICGSIMIEVLQIPVGKIGFPREYPALAIMYFVHPQKQSHTIPSTEPGKRIPILPQQPNADHPIFLT